MPALQNQRWELYAQALAKGKTSGDAYAAAGYAPNPRNASRLKKDQEIMQRVQELQAAQVEKFSLTKSWVVNMLVENAKRSMQVSAVLDDDGQPVGTYHYNGAVANRALELLGKEIGMFVERTEVRHFAEFEKYTDTELVEMLAREAQALLEDQSKVIENEPDEK